jgi:hypothetical protein
VSGRDRLLEGSAPVSIVGVRERFPMWAPVAIAAAVTAFVAWFAWEC